MLGNTQEEVVAISAGRVGIMATLVVLAIGLAVMPSVLTIFIQIAGPLDVAWIGPVVQALNFLRLGTAAGLLLTLPLLGGER